MSDAVALDAVSQYLDDLIGIADFPDYPQAFNGLQVQNQGRVTCIAAAVDASEAAIRAAIEHEADFLFVHHGLFWSGAAPVTGRRYRKLQLLFDAGVALYSAHLPLDAHPKVGNNALLLRSLGVEPQGRFGRFQDTPIGWWGETDRSRDALADAVRACVGREVFVMPFGPERVQRVGIVTGGGGSFIAEAKEAGLDAFITGEGAHHTYFDAQELGLTVIYAGHYATETFGVKAAPAASAQHFGLPWSFLDLPTGL